MNPPRVYTCSPPEPLSHLLPHTIPLGHPSAPAASFLYPASNLDWRFISYMISKGGRKNIKDKKRDKKDIFFTLCNIIFFWTAFKLFTLSLFFSMI